VDAVSIRMSKDASRLHVSMVQVPVSVPGGQIAVCAIYRDITEEKHAEDRLKATSEQLRALSMRQQFAIEQERTRISREIHDELGSALIVLGWRVQMSTSTNRFSIEELMLRIRATT
jgi:two-component system, NarL family, sensor histidine kinase UhpB